ncbi:hypothetical protein BIW11_03573 [Tropilaelaps mercedesae]|uniref:Uncharacterized protein n=1 Tax=Tropilaelaps mercedesae TaxID=418985 RepID=A0A1V9XIV9_9ACAR|nr:hypothetical protein BIW11_03573 [Tropilaelaps mercedesae]
MTHRQTVPWQHLRDSRAFAPAAASSLVKESSPDPAHPKTVFGDRLFTVIYLSSHVLAEKMVFLKVQVVGFHDDCSIRKKIGQNYIPPVKKLEASFSSHAEKRSGHAQKATNKFGIDGQ